MSETAKEIYRVALMKLLDLFDILTPLSLLSISSYVTVNLLGFHGR